MTGVTGFLGDYVARRFALGGWLVIGLARGPLRPYQDKYVTHHIQLDLSADELAQKIGGLDPDACIHCAARSAVGESVRDPRADFNISAGGTFNLLEALRTRAPECRLIYVSSAAVYGDPESLPIPEDAPCRPISPYGFHKLIAEQLCREFATVYGLPTAAVRVFSVYGPGLRRQVIWDMCNRALTEPVLKLKGTGAESRDFIHAADVAEAIYSLIGRARWKAEVYNVASGTEVRIDDLARMVVAGLERRVPILFDGAETAGYPKNWKADISRLRQLDIYPTITLESGIEDFVHWCQREHTVEPSRIQLL